MAAFGGGGCGCCEYWLGGRATHSGAAVQVFEAEDVAAAAAEGPQAAAIPFEFRGRGAKELETAAGPSSV